MNWLLVHKTNLLNTYSICSLCLKQTCTFSLHTLWPANPWSYTLHSPFLWFWLDEPLYLYFWAPLKHFSLLVLQSVAFAKSWFLSHFFSFFSFSVSLTRPDADVGVASNCPSEAREVSLRVAVWTAGWYLHSNNNYIKWCVKWGDPQFSGWS